MSVVRAFRGGVATAASLIGLAVTLTLFDDLAHVALYRHWPRWRRRTTVYAAWTYCDRCGERATT